jgi:hypothetical protein
VNIAVRSKAKRFRKRKENIDGIAELKKSPCKNHSEVNLTYAEHVENSGFRVTKRKKASSVCRVGGDEAKIIIRGVHVTAEEFVHTLMPNGEVDLNFMWLCCVAIMLDWGSKTKTILNQPTIVRFTALILYSYSPTYLLTSNWYKNTFLFAEGADETTRQM